MTGLARDLRRYLSGRLLLAIGSVAAAPLLLRWLGLDGYGRYSLAMAGASALAQLSAGWLQQGVLRFRAERERTGDGASLAATVRRAARLCALVAAALATALGLRDGLGAGALVPGALTAAIALSLPLGARAQAALQPGVALAADACRLILPLLLLLPLALSGIFPWPLWLTALGCAALGTQAGNLLLERRIPERSADGFEERTALELLRFGGAMSVWLGLNALQGIVVLESFRRFGADGAFGTYAAVSDLLVKVGSTLLMPVTYAVHGRLMALRASGEAAQARQALALALRWQFLLGAALLAGVALAAPLLSAFLFGRRLSGWSHAPGFALVALGVVTGNLALLAHKGLEATGRTLPMLAAAASMVVATGLAARALAPLGGIWMAGATTIGNLLYIALTLKLSARCLREA